MKVKGLANGFFRYILIHNFLFIQTLYFPYIFAVDMECSCECFIDVIMLAYTCFLYEM